MAERKPPKIRVGNTWIPAHRLWKLVESVNTATDLVEQFNEKRAHLNTPITEAVVARVRERIREMELNMGGEGSLKAAAALAAELEAAEAEARRGDNEIVPPKDGKHRLPKEAFTDATRQLLESMPLEDALRMLKEDYGENIAIRDLVAMVGTETYQTALARDARDMRANMITPDQIALLWNESGIARPTGGLWTERDIVELTA